MGQADKLRKLLADPGVLVLPGCFDAMSARLIERAGYPGAFMGGFAVSASRIAMPDTGLISYSEMVDQGRNICAAVDFPVIGDGDTGYGNAVNVQRTVQVAHILAGPDGLVAALSRRRVVSKFH